MEEARPVLSVKLTRDGVWSVNERGPSRVAIAYFPRKWGAMKHAVRVARANRRCRGAPGARGPSEPRLRRGAARARRRGEPQARLRGAMTPASFSLRNARVSCG